MTLTEVRLAVVAHRCRFQLGSLEHRGWLFGRSLRMLAGEALT